MEGRFRHVELEQEKIDAISRFFVSPSEEARCAYSATVKIRKAKQACVVVTRGGLYLAKWEKGSATLYLRVPLLGLKVRTTKSGVEFQREGVVFEIRGDDVNMTITIIDFLINETFFGVADHEKLERDLSVHVKAPPVKKVVENAMSWRFIMLAHKVPVIDRDTNAFDWMERIGMKNKIAVDETLRVGPYGEAFGAAMAMETKLEAVSFQLFPFHKFPELMTSFVFHAQGVKKVGMLGYTSPVDYGFGKAGVTSIKEWAFVRCSMDFVIDWIRQIDVLPAKGVLHLELSEMRGNLSELIPHMRESKQLKGLIRVGFMVMKDRIESGILRSFLSELPSVRTVVCISLDCDASNALAAIISGAPNLQSVFLQKMTFKTPIPESIVLPPDVTYFDVSFSPLKAEILRSILRLLVKNPRAKPISFVASGCAKISRNERSLAKMDLSQCYPTLSEVNWSNNRITGATCHALFAFLFTQKRLRWLSMSRCDLTDTFEFLKNLVRLVLMLPLYGLDFAEVPRCKESDMVEFIQAIGISGRLRRLNLSGFRARDEGMQALFKLIEENPLLCELSVDGFCGTDAKLVFNFWSKLSRKRPPSLKVCEYPIRDLESIRSCQSDAAGKLEKRLKSLCSHKGLSSEYQRGECHHYRNTSSIDIFSLDIFSVAFSVDVV